MEAPVYHLENAVKTKNEQEDFNGPLDLILYLLSKNKMQIADIQISEILEQYLEWMDRRKKMDLEVASEFVSMASQLIFIKTRMLLNVHDEEAISEVEQLKAELEEHQRHENYIKIKQITKTMGERYGYGKNYIAKPPEPMKADNTYRYVHKPEDLLKGIRNVLIHANADDQPILGKFSGIVGHEPYPVENKARELLSRLIRGGVMAFKSLFKGSKTRSEVVATFLAVLELCRSGRVNLAGTESECTVTCVNPEDDGSPLTGDEET